MLTVLAAQPVHPEIESVDRDPGIITLLSVLVRVVRRGGRAAGEEVGASRRKAVEAGLFGSATAWPHSHR